MPDYPLIFLQSYLEGRTYTVHLNDTTSIPESTPSSLSQGAVLSTTLIPLRLSDIPRPPHTHLTLYADDTALLSQFWRPDTIPRRLSTAITTLHKYFTTCKLRLKKNKTEALLYSKCRPPLRGPNQFQDNFGPWTSTVRCLVLVLDSKLLFSRHLHTVANKATGASCNIIPLLARDSALTQTNKLTLYKLLIRSNLTYAAPVWSSICPCNHHRLQVIKSKYLRVIGNHPSRTSNSHLHNSLNIQPIIVLTHRLTDKFFVHCPSHPTPQSNKQGIIL